MLHSFEGLEATKLLPFVEALREATQVPPYFEVLEVRLISRILRKKVVAYERTMFPWAK